MFEQWKNRRRQSLDEIQRQIDALIAHDPTGYQQAVFGSRTSWMQTGPGQATKWARSHGIPVPEGYVIDNGRLRRIEGLPTWVKIAMAATGGLAGAGALGLLGSGAGAGSGGGAGGAAASAGFPAVEGGATLAANLGGAGALGTLPATNLTGLFGLGDVPHLAGLGPGSAGLGDTLGDVLRRLLPALPGLALGAGQAFGGGRELPEELKQLLQMGMSRMQAQQPLFEATNRQLLAGLPTYAQQPSAVQPR